VKKNEYYDEYADTFYSETVNLDVSLLHKRFLKYLKRNARILDAGCGSGRDSKLFLRDGFEVLAFDASCKLVELASNNIGQTVKHMKFQEITFKSEFDAVWACASLLHVPESEIDGVFEKLLQALKKHGILYTSFKYGNDEVLRGGRSFNNYNEEKYKELLSRHKSAELIEAWKTRDSRKERDDEYWFNAIVKKG
jgi:SAM-dependent methyltransferase